MNDYLMPNTIHAAAPAQMTIGGTRFLVGNAPNLSAGELAIVRRSIEWMFEHNRFCEHDSCLVTPEFVYARDADPDDVAVSVVMGIWFSGRDGRIRATDESRIELVFESNADGSDVWPVGLQGNY